MNEEREIIATTRTCRILDPSEYPPPQTKLQEAWEGCGAVICIFGLFVLLFIVEFTSHRVFGIPRDNDNSGIIHWICHCKQCEPVEKR